MNDDALRKAANAAAAGEIQAECQKYLDQIRAAMERGEFQVQELPSPKEGAARAFQVTVAGFMLNVLQANVIDDESDPSAKAHVIHRGMAVASKGRFNVIVLPPEFVDYVYHKAAGTRN